VVNGGKVSGTSLGMCDQRLVVVGMINDWLWGRGQFRIL